jgi:hypothetical protein
VRHDCIDAVRHDCIAMRVLTKVFVRHVTQTSIVQSFSSLLVARSPC